MKRTWLSPSMGVALAALFVALSGGAYAMIHLPANSVGTAQLKNHAVTSQKVKAGSLLASAFAPGQLPSGPRGPKGETGARGLQGLTGANGVSKAFTTSRGSSDVGDTLAEVSTLTLPAGHYLVWANGTFSSSDATILHCTLGSLMGNSFDPTVDVATNSFAGALSQPVGLFGPVQLTNPTTISLVCYLEGATGVTASVSDAQIDAVAVDTIS